MERHREFYHFGRALCETADYYGIPLRANEHVYHGLDKKMRFQSFHESFHGPISTSPSENSGMIMSRFKQTMILSRCACLSSALLFAKDTGTVLKLEVDEDHGSDGDDAPRYVPVQDISAFPGEKEYLFSGNHNRFKLVDVKDCRTGKWYPTEMSALRKFQQMLQQEFPEWTDAEISMIQEYVQFIVAKYVIYYCDDVELFSMSVWCIDA